MTGTAETAFDCHFIEDVILTLATLRGLIGWIGASDDCPAGARAAAAARATREIDATADRARALLHGAGAAAPRDPAEIVNLFDTGDGAAPAPCGRPVFQTRRACA